MSAGRGVRSRGRCRVGDLRYPGSENRPILLHAYGAARVPSQPKPVLEMLFTGKPITAQRAYELGLVNRVVQAAGLDAAVQEFADAILAASPLTVRLGKAAFYEGLALDEAEAYRRATSVMTDNALRHDAQEGMSAFLQKRRPEWRNS